MRTVLLEVGIVLGLLKKTLLKTSKIVLMYSNSLARNFSPMFHAKIFLSVILTQCIQEYGIFMSGLFLPNYISLKFCEIVPV